MKLKNLKSLVTFSFILFMFSGASFENVTLRDLEFIKQHTLPFENTFKEAESIFSAADIIEALESRDLDTLEKHGFKFYSTWGNIVMEHPRLSSWIIKTGSRFGNDCNNILRIAKANKLRKCIEANKYKDLVVPSHYLFHIPGKDITLKNANYLVFCEKVDIADKNLGHLTPKQVSEICRLIRESGMCDTRGDNIRILKNGKVAFVDTEPFLELNTSWWRALEKFGLRVFKGALGAHIFRRTVAKDRKINRREAIMAKNIERNKFQFSSNDSLKISFIALKPRILTALLNFEIDKYLS